MLDLSGLRNDWRIFRQTLRTSTIRETFIDTVQYYRVKSYEKLEGFDQTYGTETSRMIGTDDLGGIGPHQKEASHYWPTRQREFDRMLETLGDINHTQYSFVDLGCGLGRIVLLAAGLPFKRVIGIDFSPAFITQAKQNVSRYSGPVQAGEIELHLMDAAEFAIPPENLLVYMFSPFGPPVITAVMHNLMSAARQRQQDIKLVYYSPDYDDVVQDAGFQLIGSGQGDHWPWHVYSCG